MNGDRREHQYRGGYTKCLESEREWDEDSNLEHIWEQVKQAMAEVLERFVAQ